MTIDMEGILDKIAIELGIDVSFASNTERLIDEGNSIVFISRYRKELTGDMDDQMLRAFEERLSYHRNLESRKLEVINLISEQGKITPELETKILSASLLKEVEDLYLPFRPKKRTRATVAREKGLEPLAAKILSLSSSDDELIKLAEEYIDIDKGVEDVKAAIAGAKDIAAEVISENADFKRTIRNITFRNSSIHCSLSKGAQESNEDYTMFDGLSEALMSIPGHRVLAINRGEKKKALKVSIEAPTSQIVEYLKGRIQGKHKSEILQSAIEDSYSRLIKPSMETEMRSSITELAQQGAIKVFSRNLKSLLLQQPVRGKTILGFDPGFKNGCKLAAIDSFGKVLGYGVIHLEKRSALGELAEFVENYSIDAIAIGNGTASREAEELVSKAIKMIERKVSYVIVNEAGASVYSASKLASEEYPDYDVLARGAISIAQRLRDPLAELVKIDPKSIGVGQYQHDVNQVQLAKELSNVVEEAVNSVGINVNTASPALLSYVAGITKKTATNIFSYVKGNGGIKSREELKKVPGIGEKSFEQCAGFLRIPESSNILDNTAVHPESYEAVYSLISYCGVSIENLKESFPIAIDSLSKIDASKAAKDIGIGEYTFRDILTELKKPGRDPREDFGQIQFRTGPLEIKDLEKGMELQGTIRNVTNFGAYVDIGVHIDGLVHISELSDRFVKDPFEIVVVGDVVDVRVLDVDTKRERISLSMKGFANQKRH